MTEERLHEVSGALDKVIFRKLKAVDELSQPFHYEVELLSESFDISPYDVVGKTICISIKTNNNSKRFFHGIVSSFMNVGQVGGYQLYHVELRPWLWLLSHSLDCKIFQNKNVREILEEVFKTKNGFTDFRFEFQGTYKSKEYCVQYRESDFNFVSRLMEEEGIFYYFVHEKEKHTLVMADQSGSVTAIEGDGEIVFRPPNEVATGDEHIFYWKHHVAIQTVNFAIRDYDYEKPLTNLESRRQSTIQHPHTHLEKYDYPGSFSESADGVRNAKLLAEESTSRFSNIEGKGRSFRLRTGSRFKLKEHPRSAENKEYVVLSSTTNVTSGEIESFTSDQENRFEVEFNVIEKMTPFRPARVTQKPVIAGPQTAVVTGKEGEEIWTDSLGRIKVQFHWDRVGEKNESSSCWIRVAQMWAGKNWGAIHIPRIGQEVVVEFLEGDPDRPLVTGRVYNKDQTVPYELPANASQSGIKSRATPDGEAANFNELRFEDKKDQEKVYFHAEKDFERIVEDNDLQKIGFEKKSDGNQTIEIFNDQIIKVGTSESKSGSQTLDVWKDQTETIKTGNRAITIDQGNDTLTIKQGNKTISVAAGECTITAAKKIVLEVGQSSIIIEPAKISLQSTQISIVADMKVDVNGNIVNVNGSSVLKLEGGLIKIN